MVVGKKTSAVFTYRPLIDHIPGRVWPEGGCLPGGCLSRGVSVGGCLPGGVPCDLSHHAFDVTCILSLLQLRLKSNAAAYIVVVMWPGKACWDTHPLPLDRILDTRLWKHYLPATTVACGNKKYFSLQSGKIIAKEEYVHENNIQVFCQCQSNATFSTGYQVNWRSNILQKETTCITGSQLSASLLECKFEIGSLIRSIYNFSWRYTVTHVIYHVFKTESRLVTSTCFNKRKFIEVI